MKKLRFRFGIRTIFAITTLVALSTFFWLIPFEPDVAFSQPVLPKSAKLDSDYVQLETTVTNKSFWSTWIPVYNDHLASYSCKPTEVLPNYSVSTYSLNVSGVETYKRLRSGESAKIEIIAGTNWEQYEIDFDVFDWRGRKFNAKSGPVAHN